MIRSTTRFWHILFNFNNASLIECYCLVIGCSILLPWTLKLCTSYVNIDKCIALEVSILDINCITDPQLVPGHELRSLAEQVLDTLRVSESCCHCSFFGCCDNHT
jgi:hypothetical protein